MKQGKIDLSFKGEKQAHEPLLFPVNSLTCLGAGMSSLWAACNPEQLIMQLHKL